MQTSTRAKLTQSLFVIASAGVAINTLGSVKDILTGHSIIFGKLYLTALPGVESFRSESGEEPGLESLSASILAPSALTVAVSGLAWAAILFLSGKIIRSSVESSFSSASEKLLAAILYISIAGALVSAIASSAVAVALPMESETWPIENFILQVAVPNIHWELGLVALVAYAMRKSFQEGRDYKEQSRGLV